MKRNNLMKRMAVVALAATMSVGMAVPAMAATGNAAITTDRAHGDDLGFRWWTQHRDLLHQSENAVDDWYTIDSFKDNVSLKFFNATISGQSENYNPGSTQGFLNDTVSGVSVHAPEQATDVVYPGTHVSVTDDFALFKDGSLYVRDHNTYRKVDYAQTKEPISPVWDSGIATWTVGEKDDTGYYVVWTVKAVNDNYFKTSVKDNELSLTPNEFGTTVYDYTGKLYHNGKYVGTTDGDVTGRFAVTMPLNRFSIDEVTDDSLTVTPTAAPNSKAAAAAAQASVKAGLDARKPKVLNFQEETRQGWTIYTYKTQKNLDHDLDVEVNNVTNYHLDSATNTGSYKAHVVVTDKTIDRAYDLGVKTFTIKPEDVVAFDDVASTAYYYDAVVWGVKNGVVKGTSDTTFSPYDNFTREQVALMLYREAGSPEVDYSDVETVKFHDIGSLSEESKKAIAWGVQNGIIKGTSDVTFSPKEGITRAQLVTLLYRLSGDKAEYNEDGFTDVQHGKYYEDAVDWAVAKGVTTGTTKTTFSPYDVTTRAQGITFLYRFYNLK